MASQFPSVSDQVRATWSDRLEVAVMLFSMLVCFVVIARLFDVNILNFHHVNLEVTNAKVLGVIESTQRSVRRRPVHLPIWIDALAKDPVVRGDQVFTDANSKATVAFNNGVKVDVLEHSLIVIDDLSQSNTLEVREGEVLVSLSQKQNSVAIVQGNKKVHIFGRDSLVSVKKLSSGKTSVHTIKGNVTFSTPKAPSNRGNDVKGASITTSVIDGQSVIIESKQGVIAAAFQPQLLYPVNNYVADESYQRKVDFAWTFSPESIRFVVLELSEHEDFRSPILQVASQDGIKEIADLKVGSYFWRAIYHYKDAKAPLFTTAARKISVIAGKAVNLTSPFPWQRFSAVVPPANNQEMPKIEVMFSWQETASSGNSVIGSLNQAAGRTYLLEIADNAEFRNPVVRSRHAATSAYQVLSGEGTYFWRVGKMASKKGKNSQSETLWSPTWAFVILKQLDEPVGLQSDSTRKAAGSESLNEDGSNTLPPPKILRKEFIGH